MVQSTTLNNATTVEPTIGNYTNHTNHVSVDDENNSKVILIIIIITVFIVCSLLEGFHRVVTSGNESFLMKIIKIPFIMILSMPDFIILFIIMPLGASIYEKYVDWKKSLKQYWYITCLNCINVLFNIPQQETLPQNIAEAYIDEVNRFFSDEYDTIEYSKEEIDVCSICMEKLYINCETKNEKSVLLTCGHSFHEECLKSWYRSSIQKDCPMCRETLEIKNYYVFKDI